MATLYYPIIKLGESEIKALENSNAFVIDNINPIIEITRGRKSSATKVELGGELYPFDKRFGRIKSVFNGKPICIDLTSDEDLMNGQIRQLYNPENGYNNWITFLSNLESEKTFSDITPCIVINGMDDNFEANLKAQANSLVKIFGKFIYRSSIIDESCYSDLKTLKEYIGNLIVLIDCDYVIQPQANEVTEKIRTRINNLNELCNHNISTYIISSTSFPKSISKIGNDDADEFFLSEVKIFSDLKKDFKNIIYSDYCSVNPSRNDTVVMARGWIPRIDVPLKDKIYYIRQRRPKGITQYASTYSDVARQIVKTKDFPNLEDNWGIEQIINCSEGAAPSSVPSFWIAVRMCIHLETQCERIYLRKM